MREVRFICEAEVQRYLLDRYLALGEQVLYLLYDLLVLQLYNALAKSRFGMSLKGIQAHIQLRRIELQRLLFFIVFVEQREYCFLEGNVGRASVFISVAGDKLEQDEDVQKVFYNLQ